MSTETTRTTLFGIFVLSGGPLTAGQVIALAEPLRLSATNVKSHLTRMVGEGVLRRAGRRRFARYSPTEKQRHVIDGIAERLGDEADQAWDGRWLLLTPRLPSSRSARNRLREALWFDGFRPCSTAAFLRPAWPTPWALLRAQAYVREFSGICSHGTLLGSIDAVLVRHIYDLDALDREAGRLARKIAAIHAADDSAADAFAARLTIGGQVAQLVANDPRLPAALWDSRTGLRDLLRAYHRIDAQLSTRSAQFIDEILGRDRAAGRRNRSVKR
jgi:DNA-binding transcriptional regulator PaaX